MNKLVSLFTLDQQVSGITFLWLLHGQMVYLLFRFAKKIGKLVKLIAIIVSCMMSIPKSFCSRYCGRRKQTNSRQEIGEGLTDIFQKKSFIEVIDKLGHATLSSHNHDYYECECNLCEGIRNKIDRKKKN